MSNYSVAVIGTGPHPENASHDGYSMGYRHARGYEKVANCEIQACADIDRENASDFGQTFHIGNDGVYTDHKTMLTGSKPDIVSICTPPATHPELVADCARADGVQAIHCEKPMAVTFGQSRKLLEVCAEHDVQLSVNLQNRCANGVERVKELVDDGEIGELQRIEVARHDLLQTGIHHIDLANYLVDDAPIDWVLGQIDYPEEKVWYTGMHVATQSLGMWRYESGVHGLCSMGAGMSAVGKSTNQVLGSDGRIEIDLAHHQFSIRRAGGSGWESIDVEQGNPQDDAIAEVVEALEEDREPRLSGRIGLSATEVVFAVWESARRRGRVSLPLSIEDNPLEELVRSGEIPPRK